MADDQTPAPLGTPGPLTQAAIDKAKSLSDNQLDFGAGTTDFQSVDLTFGVKKTWRNGWGAGAWIGAKIGSGKPIGSAGVTVSKRLGLLGEVDTMNWLQRNLPSRDSWKWVFATAAAVCTYLAAEIEVLHLAFELSEQAEQRIRILAAVLGIITGKMSWSWMPTKERQEQAKVIHAVEKAIDAASGPDKPTS